MRQMNTIDWIAFTLVVIGGLNWGAVGVFKFNFVAEVFDPSSVLTRVIYSLVGLATVYLLVTVSIRGSSANSPGGSLE